MIVRQARDIITTSMSDTKLLKLSEGVLELSFRTSRSSFLPPPLGLLGGSDRERFEFAHEVV